MFINNFQISWTFIIFVLSVVFQAGGTIYMLLQHSRDIKQMKKDIADNKKDVNRRLYDRENLPIFTPITRCGELRNECKEARQKEYDHMAEQLRIHGKKVDQMVNIFRIFIKKNLSFENLKSQIK